MVVRGTWWHIEETEEMHRRTRSCYKRSIIAENSTARESSYIKEGFRLQIRFVEMGLGGVDKEKKEKNGKWEGEQKGNCPKNGTGEKECKSIGKYRFLKT